MRIIIALLILMSSVPVQAANDAKEMGFQELCTTDSLERAIRDLSKTFGRGYPHGKSYLNRLSQIKTMDDIGAKREALNTLKREALLANPLLDFDKILLVRRNLSGKARSATGTALGLPQLNADTLDTIKKPGQGWKDDVVELSNLRGQPKLRTVYKPARPQIIAELELHFDGQRIMFSSGDADNNWNIYEFKEGQVEAVQLTPQVPDVSFFDSCYLPNGRVALTSTAVYQGIPCRNGKLFTAVLYLLDPVTKELRQIGFEQDSDWGPTVMNNGRLMYLRWEYTDLPHFFSRILFSCNPDGTVQMAEYGSNSYFPNAFNTPRVIPNHPSKIIGIAGGHHGVSRAGRLLILDTNLGRSEADGVVQEIPGYGKKVEPIIKDRMVDGVWPQFLSPYPLNENYHLVSMKPNPQGLWGLYLVDVFDNAVKLLELEDCALMDPIAYRITAAPPIIPDRTNPKSKTGAVYLADVYNGPGLAGVPRGKVKKLRLFSYYFAHHLRGGHQSVGQEASWDVKRILGTVPVEEDGSALFAIPAQTPISIQPLDQEGRALQLMRSWMVAMPGETVSCNGCHENKDDAPTVKRTRAAHRPPSTIEPWYGPARAFSFVSEVQPVLDKYCVGCHDGQNKSTPDFSINHADDYSKDKSYMALQAYVRRPGPEGDLHMCTPLEYHASTSELVQMLERGHNNVQLDSEAWDRLCTWIDLNVPHRGQWRPAPYEGHDQQERRMELARRYTSVHVDVEAEYASFHEQIARQPKPEPIIPAALAQSEPEKVSFAGWSTDYRQGMNRRRTLNLGAGLSMKLVYIPAGQFVKGSNGAVHINKPFWMGQFEVTNQQYHRFNPDHDSKYIDMTGKDQSARGFPANGPKQPVIRVAWQEAVDFCAWLSQQTGYKVSLPTEAQWEWACRAGTETPFWFGDLEADFSTRANLADQSIRDVRKLIKFPHSNSWDDGQSIVADVGRYQANPWGLHDMHGNVSEWTLNTDQKSAEARIVCGGSWRDRPSRATVSHRQAYPSWQRVYNVGFRVVVEEDSAAIVLNQ
ncbi:SUMF1/EgtB/PvdO family nonheme iron enzyme [Planctomycetota bacterium]